MRTRTAYTPSRYSRERQVGTFIANRHGKDTDVARRQRSGEKVYICPVEVTLEVIDGKWKSLILWHLKTQTRRFAELRRLMPSITQRMLTQQLRELEADGVVARKVYAVIPPKVEYSLTDLGNSLRPILDQMCEWGQKRLKGLPGARLVSRGDNSSSAIRPVSSRLSPRKPLRTSTTNHQ
jgi:DNA-binding HxlR family transcriptional regulator